MSYAALITEQHIRYAAECSPHVLGRAFGDTLRPSERTQSRRSVRLRRANRRASVVATSRDEYYLAEPPLHPMLDRKGSGCVQRRPELTNTSFAIRRVALLL